MRNSKPLKRIISLLVLLALLLSGELALTFILEPVSYATYFNHDIEMLEENGTDVEMIFVGASRVVRSFIPQTFEDSLRMNAVVNAGSVLQMISSSYYQLLDLLERFEPSHVVLGVTAEALWIENNTQAKLIVLDRLHGANKLKYVADVFEPDEYLYALSGSYRLRANLTPGIILDNLSKKTEIAKGRYEDDKTDDFGYYADTGFVYSDTFCANGNVEICNPITTSQAYNYTELAYLDKIVALCKERGITLHLVTGPTTMMQIYNTDDYQACHDWYANFAEVNGLSYHNLNLLKGREEFLPDEYMFDFNHVNGTGAKITSELYAQILKEEAEGKDTSGYFYESVEELKADVHRVVAVGAEIAVSGQRVRVEVTSLQNEDVTPYYQLSLCMNGGVFETVVDWIQEESFDIDLPEYEACTLMVRAKIGQDGEIEAYQCYDLAPQ